MTDLETVTVAITVDRNSLNQFLGNTSNVTAEAAISEFLETLFTETYGYCDRCGSGSTEQTNVKGHFEVL